MKLKLSLKNYAMLCGVVVLALLILYGALVAFTGFTTTSPNPIAVHNTVHCSFFDRSFCSTDKTIKSLVSSQDFSSILEDQTPTNITCTQNQLTQSYCQGIQNGMSIQVFAVHEGPSYDLLTRNQYISFLRAYFVQYGPFSYESDLSSGPQVVMNFTGANHTTPFTVRLAKISSQWKIMYISVAANT